jgi:hypothetical protein
MAHFMKGFLRACCTRWAATISIVTCAGLLAILTLAASPQLHEWLHHGADQPGHHCAVTMVLDNGLHTSATTVVPLAPPQWILLDRPVHFSGENLGSLFLSACIFEHAPPLA